MTTATTTAAHRWRARPGLSVLLRAALLAVPLVASSAVVYGLARWMPQTASTWWGLGILLLAGLLVATAVERGARRLLPITLLLRLSMIFPDRAPSRLQLARAAAGRRPRDELLWTGPSLAPTSTSDLVLALVSALGSHDRRTRGHCERVRLLCDMLAVELKLDSEARERLRWAALLHDVGKVDVSSRILNKPGALSSAEVEQVRLHPVAGAALAAPLLPWLGEWGEGILDHHERFDGTGYPHGKAGEQISAAGRLIGLIDAFETMTAARPYKKAMATRSAREELARCAGTHFDPVYVRAFLAISLPRLLWAMGPLSFLLQLPFLQALAQTGARASAAAPQVAAGAAGAAVLATGGAATVPPPAVEAGERPGGARVTEQAGPVGGTAADAPVASAAPRPAATSAVAALRTAATPAPVAAPGPPAVAAAPVVAATAAPSAEPERRQGSPAATPASDRDQDAEAPEDEEHPAIVSGPPRTTSSRTVTFELVDEPGVQWECQLVGAGNGSASRWQPCSGTFSVTTVRDGDQVLRVRDAETRDLVDSWEWTVTATEDEPAEDEPAEDEPAEDDELARGGRPATAP